MAADYTPYQLGYDPTTNRVCVRGPMRIMQQLSMVHSRQLHTGHISLPDERLTYLMVEALETPEGVTPLYKERRALAMAPDPRRVKAICDGLRARQIDPDRPVPHDPSVKILQHQLEFCCEAYWQRGIFNASEAGTAKTLSNLLMAYLWDCERVLVACPKSVIPEWTRQHNQWFAHLPEDFRFKVWEMNTVPVKERAVGFQLLRQEAGRHIAVINFDTLADLERDIAVFAPDLVIIDEGHNVKNHKAKRTMALQKICDRAKHVINATGTPIGNDVGDLYAQACLIDRRLMPAKHSGFMSRFAEYMTVKKHDGTVLKTESGVPIRKVVGCLDPAGLMALLEPVWFRATKETCLNLPPKQYQEIRFDMPRFTRAIYREVKSKGEQALGDELSLNGALVTAIRLQQIAGGHAHYFVEGQRKRRIEELACAKLDWLIALAVDQLDSNPGTRCIVWCRFKPEVTRIHRELTAKLGAGRVVAVDGATSNEQLDEWKQSFNSRDPKGVQVIVAQIDKLHSGHNLQAGDIHVYYSHTWSHLRRSQSEDRSHRAGREGGIIYYDLVYRQSIDVEVMAALRSKKDLALRLAPDTVSGVLGPSTITDFSQLIPVQRLLEEKLCPS